MFRSYEWVKTGIGWTDHLVDDDFTETIESTYEGGVLFGLHNIVVLGYGKRGLPIVPNLARGLMFLYQDHRLSVDTILSVIRTDLLYKQYMPDIEIDLRKLLILL